jgi:opacity protein-like surface antigen
MRFVRILPLLLCCCFAIPRPAAAAKGSLSGFEAMTSTIMTHGQSSFSGLGFRAIIHPPRMLDGINLMPSFEYWRNTANVQPYDINSAKKDACLAMNVRFDFKPKGWNPYLGAGYALHFLSSEVQAPQLGIPSASHSLTKGGFTGLGGVSFPITDRFSNFVDVQYHFLPDYEQFKINWGLGFSL